MYICVHLENNGLRYLKVMDTPKLCSPTLTKHGQIQVIFGPMFSGKTTELIRRLKRYQIANHKCLIFKYTKDERYGKDGIVTHRQHLLGDWH